MMFLPIKFVVDDMRIILVSILVVFGLSSCAKPFVAGRRSPERNALYVREKNFCQKHPKECDFSDGGDIGTPMEEDAQIY